MSGTPAYLQVAAELRRQITSGALPVGEKIPSMTQLRELYSVSNTVIRDALNELRREGLIVGQQGKGVFVQEIPSPSDKVSDEAKMIHERLDAITKTVRRLDERMAALEQAAAQDSPAQRQAKRDAE
jgi:DNA-binding GntR family transcriptional regulator